MKHPFTKLAQLILIGLTLSAPFSAAFAEDQRVPPDPAKIEESFIAFTPNIPLTPGSLNLFGYETAKIAMSWPILSPDKSRLVYSQVFFIPDTDQTTSRVLAYPTGPLPELKAVMTPDNYADWEKAQQKHPDTPQPVLLREVSHQPFWDRYLPNAQAKQTQILHEAGFERSKPYSYEVVQPVDWSKDGSKILIVYRPGVHHSGVFRTIPIVIDIDSKQSYQFAALAQGVWSEFKKLNPEAVSNGPTTWDIRPLGWSADMPTSIIVKLVLFKGQNEVPSGFWQYDMASGSGRYLGTEISESSIARNGYIVRFVFPLAPGGPKSYGPDDLPNQEQPQVPVKFKKKVR